MAYFEMRILYKDDILISSQGLTPVVLPSRGDIIQIIGQTTKYKVIEIGHTYGTNNLVSTVRVIPV